jgi:hypothetical protein
MEIVIGQAILIHEKVLLETNSPISWKSTRQRTPALSALEAEYMSQAEAARQAIWFRGLINEISDRIDQITIYGDNQRCQSLARNRQVEARTKHIDVRYHFIRDCIENNSIHFEYCPTESMLADFLTNQLTYPNLNGGSLQLV